MLCSGRDERTFMKMIVHVPTNRVVGCHMVSALGC
jgi:pyruvate/2-oxoglutarate dehydrogenase complex dihydrolipoamide dehydrogenase (E3) component